MIEFERACLSLLSRYLRWLLLLLAGLIVTGQLVETFREPALLDGRECVGLE